MEDEGRRSRSGDVVLPVREDTQSWTRMLTCGFWMRLRVFLEEGFVVIIIVGEEANGVDGR